MSTARRLPRRRPAATRRWPPARTPVRRGSTSGPSELRPEERRLLEALERDVSSPRTDAPEDSESAVHAAEDEAPLPAHGGQQDDGLSVVFDPPPDL